MRLFAFAALLLLLLPLIFVQNRKAGVEVRDTEARNGQPVHEQYEYKETRELVRLVRDAAELVRAKGEAAFDAFRTSGSRWRKGETYLFVLEPDGNMLVHSDPAMEGKNRWDLKDINGKPIIQGLIGAATTVPGKQEGWYHYQWITPGGLLPRWKSSFVQLVKAPSGKSYVVGTGIYNERMERAFVVDAVKDAVGLIETKGKAALALFRDPTGPFLAKDAYIFVYDMRGTNLALPPFPSLEGRHLIDLEDTHGKKILREMLNVAETRGSGWVDYMWPKPGESVSTQKAAYVSKARLGYEWVLVGCGVYLEDAPREAPAAPKMTAPELMSLVRDAARVFEAKGEQAYPAFRKQGSRWLHDDTYFFVWSMDGVRLFHGANAAIEGLNVREIKDSVGRPFGKMFLDVAAGPAGEGWIHYTYPEPGGLFPTWKSTFVKRVTFPSGSPRLIGCGIYNMQMDKVFIEDVVNRAAALITEKGKAAFPELRDKTGPFLFMDTYVFVETPEGIELVNPVHPSLEGKSLVDLKDVNGRAVVQEEIAAAMKDGKAWLEMYWFKPGTNLPTRKQTFVRKVQSGRDTFIVGSGYYVQ